MPAPITDHIDRLSHLPRALFEVRIDLLLAQRILLCPTARVRAREVPRRDVGRPPGPDRRLRRPPLESLR